MKTKRLGLCFAMLVAATVPAIASAQPKVCMNDGTCPEIACSGTSCTVYPQRQHLACATYGGDSAGCAADEYCTWTGSSCTGSGVVRTETWYIGMVFVNGTQYAAACLDEYGTVRTGPSGTTSSDEIFILGPSTGLDHDYTIYGEPSGATVGNTDYVDVVPYNSFSPPTGTNCYRDVTPPLQGITSVFNRLNFNGHALVIHGQFANDYLDNGWTGSVAELYGDSDTDLVRNRSDTAFIHGGTGGDNMCSTVSGRTHFLYADDGGDCVNDTGEPGFQNNVGSGGYLSCGASSIFTGLDDLYVNSGSYGGSDSSCEVNFSPITASACSCTTSF